MIETEVGTCAGVTKTDHTFVVEPDIGAGFKMNMPDPSMVVFVVGTSVIFVGPLFDVLPGNPVITNGVCLPRCNPIVIAIDVTERTEKIPNRT